MKKHPSLVKRCVLIVLVSGAAFIAAVGLSSWKGGPASDYYRANYFFDTVPQKKSDPLKDLDKELKQLEEAKKQFEELKTRDWEKMQQDLDEALKNIDFEKLSLQVQGAIAKVDFEKIGIEAEKAIRKIDFTKLQDELEQAMNEVPKIDKEKLSADLEKVRLQIQEQVKNRDWSKAFEETKKLNMKEVERELEKVKEQMQKVKEVARSEKLDLSATMSKAATVFDKAKEELTGYQEMIYQMEKDGLLNTSKDYVIDFNKGELSVNGIKQTQQIQARYKKYFRTDRVTIKKSGGDIHIDND